MLKYEQHLAQVPYECAGNTRVSINLKSKSL